MGRRATASPSKNAAANVARFLRLRQKRSEIKISGKKVSLVTIPNAHTRPVKAASRRIRINRREPGATDSLPIPNKISSFSGAADGATTNKQQQTAAMLNGTNIRSEPNKIPYQSNDW